MLSYQHVYHAGNNADCHKHALQAVLLDALKRDTASFLYLDTHSGRGLYNFDVKEMQKLREYEQGIARLWSIDKWPREMASYKRIVQSLNRNKDTLQFYPGSPWVAEASRRPQDRLHLFELHPQEYKALHTNMGRLDGVVIEKEDGWVICDDANESPFKRGLIAIDPSYELKDEYNAMASRVKKIAANFPGFMIAIWYPLLYAERYKGMTEDLEKLELPFHKSEIVFSESDKGMIGSGLFVINPPEKYAATEQVITAWLTQHLSQ